MMMDSIPNHPKKRASGVELMSGPFLLKWFFTERQRALYGYDQRTRPRSSLDRDLFVVGTLISMLPLPAK
jgi:hypothetical protein